jgi:uridine kinase
VSVTRSELGDPWDLKIWVEAPYDLRLTRGIERDGEGMRSTWVEHWMPQEDRYVESQRPQERADVVVLGYGPNNR